MKKFDLISMHFVYVFILFELGLDSAKEHEYVLLEEVVSATLQGNSNLPTPNQRMVGMHEMPLQVRNKWRNETKFVLKRVGQDPSWRARLGNLMSFAEEQESVSEHNSPSNSRVPSEDNPFDDNANEATASEVTNDNDNAKENKTKDADNFLVCVFNVSSKVSYR